MANMLYYKGVRGGKKVYLEVHNRKNYVKENYIHGIIATMQAKMIHTL